MVWLGSAALLVAVIYIFARARSRVKQKSQSSGVPNIELITFKTGKPHIIDYEKVLTDKKE